MPQPVYTSRPSETDDPIAQLALDLQWSWNHSADRLWRHLDPELWDLTRNPWVVLQTASRQKLQDAISSSEFQGMLDEVTKAQQAEKDTPRWFQQNHPDSPLGSVAYFSMEYMLSEALPIYSGGLGNVAGDQLKAAHDLGVPVVGIGLLYQQGYFRQAIDPSGTQHAVYPFNDPGQLPLKPLRAANGDWLRLTIGLPGSPLWVRTWEVQVGRNKLYLLDTNDPANLPAYRGITSELYGGDQRLRLRQEQVLGIAGWRLLGALGLQPEVCHLNEGHAAFAVLERARAFMQETGQPFAVALAATRAGNLFTTHTPVAAGFDFFSREMMEFYFAHYAEDELKISFQDLLALGRQNPQDDSEPFNMAYLAIRGSRDVNGVSRLHGKVSQRIFQPLFPRWPESEVPVGHVTNGVHVPTWDCACADELWTKACGSERWRGDLKNVDDQIRAVDSSTLWKMRSDARTCLVEFTRERNARQVAAYGASADEVAEARRTFQPEVLTMGFARRFAEYKRPTLLLHDRERFTRILTDGNRPVQLLLAGKAHPQDQTGQDMIREWNQFIARPEIRPHVIFLADDDMMLTEMMVGGVDVWINNPRRPWEASGTSGMKILANGGLNVSELDGWWAEAYAPEVGWAIGDGQEHDASWDAKDADELYTRLEREVIPAFYERDSDGIPQKWAARMRESMARLTPEFSANRSVREYTEKHYLPAAEAYQKRAADKGKVAQELVEWEKRVAAAWRCLRFGPLRVDRQQGELIFSVPVHLDDLDPDLVRVELFADGENGASPTLQPMTRGNRLQDAGNAYAYSARLFSARNPADFTPRVVPNHSDASVPLEAGQILWGK